ncbi:MAG: hypothetical protein Q4G60_12825 [bacterium]|nr:hypothetical protein [bacterium]
MLKKFFQYEDRNFAYAFLILAGIILFSVLYAGKRPGVVDWGNYENTMLQTDLSYTQETLEAPDELHYIKVIETFDYKPFEPARLVQAKPTISMYYPVAVVRLFSEPFGIPFSTANLALVYAAMTLVSLFYILKALYRIMGYRAAVIALWIDFMLMGSEYIVWFNSLEMEACIFTGLLMFIAAVLNSITKDKGSFHSLFSVVFSAWFLLNAKEIYTAVMLPAVLLLIVALAYYHRPAEGFQVKKLVLLVACVTLMVISSYNLARNSYVLDAQANRYDSVYGGLLMVCDNPKEVIAELGLPGETIRDVGKSFYLGEDEYALNPRSEEAESLIFDRISVEKMFTYYMKHPAQFTLMLRETIPYSNTYANNRFAHVGEKTDENATTVYDFSWWSMVRNVLIPSNIDFYYVFTIASVLICLFYYLMSRKDQVRIRLIAYIAFTLMTFSQLFIPFLLSGWGYMLKEEFSFTLFQDFILLITMIFLVKMAYILGAQIGENEEAWREELYHYSGDQTASVHPIRNRLISRANRINAYLNHNLWNKRLKAAAVMTLFAGLIILYVMFFPPRIGSRNNGDFGRVMDAIGVRYTREYRIDHDLPTKMLIEDFEWQPYDWNRLTYKNPSLSNVYVAGILRALDEPRGILYSSLKAAIIYAVILILSFGMIFYQLYDMFGVKKFLILSPVIMIMFLGKMHLGWINSMFGEGVIYVSLIALTACAISIVNAKRGKGLWLFLPFLFFVLMFCDAKGQVTISFPILLLLAVILFAYHFFTEKWYLKIPMLIVVGILGAVICQSALGVYQKNNSENSSMNVWQSMFTGLLVVVDDPYRTLEDFDLDTRMAADIGKHAYYENDEYFIGPLTPEAETEIFSKIDTIKILKYYISHPKYLYRILNYAAEGAADPMPDWFMFLGQRDDLEHDEVTRFSYWEEFRRGIVPRSFIMYFIVYGIVIIYTGRGLWKDRKNQDLRWQLLRILFLAITLVGILQFPLSVIGNGLTDNVKQMYLFRLCYDINLLFTGYVIVQKVTTHFANQGHQLLPDQTDEQREGKQTDGAEKDLV